MDLALVVTSREIAYSAEMLAVVLKITDPFQRHSPTRTWFPSGKVRVVFHRRKAWVDDVATGSWEMATVLLSKVRVKVVPEAMNWACSPL